MVCKILVRSSSLTSWLLSTCMGGSIHLLPRQAVQFNMDIAISNYCTFPQRRIDHKYPVSMGFFSKGAGLASTLTDCFQSSYLEWAWILSDLYSSFPSLYKYTTVNSLLNRHILQGDCMNSGNITNMCHLVVFIKKL